ncbi:MAG: hypothetical protein WBQ78_03250 [Gammaproteobacteria bacterium]
MCGDECKKKKSSERENQKSFQHKKGYSVYVVPAAVMRQALWASYVLSGMSAKSVPVKNAHGVGMAFRFVRLWSVCANTVNKGVSANNG